jgi:hypothetical protein
VVSLSVLACPAAVNYSVPKYDTCRKPVSEIVTISPCCSSRLATDKNTGAYAVLAAQTNFTSLYIIMKLLKDPVISIKQGVSKNPVSLASVIT